MSNMHCKGEWFDLVCRSIDEGILEYSGVPLPGFPDREIQLNTTGQAGRDTLCPAYIYYEDCLKVFSNSDAFARKDKKLMDFGVGWGRILRFFMRDFLPDNLFGADINDELLSVCKSTFRWGTFIKSNAFPPIDLPDQSIDFIVGYSVFSEIRLIQGRYYEI